MGVPVASNWYETLKSYKQTRNQEQKILLSRSKLEKVQFQCDEPPLDQMGEMNYLRS